MHFILFQNLPENELVKRKRNEIEMKTIFGKMSLFRKKPYHLYETIVQKLDSPQLSPFNLQPVAKHAIF